LESSLVRIATRSSFYLAAPHNNKRSQTMARQWILTGQEGFEKSLEYQDNISIPSVQDLGPHEVLVKLYAASLNYREINIAKPGVSSEECNSL
jgi:hypothetical protein